VPGGRVEQTPQLAPSFWGSLLPGVWCYLLALRSRGLGSAYTTLHLIDGGEERAAEVLGIPYDSFSQGGLFPISYTKGTDFRPAKRTPPAQIVHWNSW
jgi:nitroreductase